MKNKQLLLEHDLHCIRVAAWRVCQMVRDCSRGRVAPTEIRVEDSAIPGFDDVTEKYSDGTTVARQVRHIGTFLDVGDLVDLLAFLKECARGSSRILCLPQPLIIQRGRGRNAQHYGSTTTIAGLCRDLHKTTVDRDRLLANVSQDGKRLLLELCRALEIRDEDLLDVFSHFSIEYSMEGEELKGKAVDCLEPVLAPHQEEAYDCILSHLLDNYKDHLPITPDFVVNNLLNGLSPRDRNRTLNIGASPVLGDAGDIPADAGAYSAGLDDLYKRQIDNCVNLLARLRLTTARNEAVAILQQLDCNTPPNVRHHRFRCYTILGAVSLREDKPTETYSWYTKALQIHPKNLIALSNAAISAALVGDFDRSAQLIQQASSIDPHSPLILKARSQVAFIDPNAGPLPGLTDLEVNSLEPGIRAQVLWAQNSKQEALDIVNTSLTTSVADATTTLLSIMWTKIIVVSEATVTLLSGKPVEGKHREMVKAAIVRANLLLDDISSQEAPRTLVSVRIELAELYLMLSEDRLARDEVDAAARVCGQEWNSQREQIQGLRIRLEMLEGGPNLANAIQEASAYVEQWSLDFARLAARASVCHDVTSAAPTLQHFVTAHPDPEIQIYVHALTGSAVPVVELAALSTAPDLDPVSMNIVLAALARQGRHDAAIDLGGRLLRDNFATQDPQDKERLILGYARLLLDAGRTSDCEKALSEWADRIPVPSVRTLLAELRLRLGDVGGAYQILCPLLPEVDGRERRVVLYYLFQCQDYLGESKAAIDTFGEYIRSKGEVTDVQFLRRVVECCCRDGEFAMAIDILERSSDWCDVSSINFLYAQTLFLGGRVEEGARHLAHTLERWRTEEDWKRAIGVVLSAKDLECRSPTTVEPGAYVRLVGDNEYYLIEEGEPWLQAVRLSGTECAQLIGKSARETAVRVVRGFPDMPRSVEVESILSPIAYVFERVRLQMERLASLGHGMWAVRVCPDNLDALIESMKAMEEGHENALAAYRDNPLPMSFLGSRPSMFKTLDDLWFRGLPIRVSIAPATDWPRMLGAREAQADCNHVLDGTSLWAIFRLGGEPLLRKILLAFPRMFASQEAYREILNIEELARSDGFIGIVDGRIHAQEMTEERRSEHQHAFREFRRTLLEAKRCRGTRMTRQGLRWEENMGPSTQEAYALARELNGVVVSEDGAYHNLFESATPRTSVLCLIDTLHDRKAVSTDEYVELVNRVFALGFHFVPVNAHLICKSLERFFTYGCSQIPSLRALSSEYGSELTSSIRQGLRLLVSMAKDRQEPVYSLREPVRSVIHTIFSTRWDAIHAETMRRILRKSLRSDFVFVTRYKEFTELVESELCLIRDHGIVSV